MGMPAEQQAPAAIAEGFVSLFEILDAFGAPMSEEHAWALAFQACKTLQRLWVEHRGSTVYASEGGGGGVRAKRGPNDSNSNASPAVPSGVFLIENLKDVRICQDGTVHSSTANAQDPQSGSKTRKRKVAISEQQLVQSVGVVLFRALDFRLGPDEQRSLSPAMDLLLDKMTSAGDGEPHDLHTTSTGTTTSGSHRNNSSTAHGNSLGPASRPHGPHHHSHRHGRLGGVGPAGRAALFHRDEDDDSEGGGRNSAADSEGGYDEGIHDVELDDETRSGSPDVESEGLTLDKVIQMCSAHMSLGNQADSHYRAVCRAFVAEWLELTTFLREVSKGTKELRSKSYEVCATGADDDVCSNLDELGFQDWARLWVQVIRELRQGVVLKKVRLDHPPQTEPSIEYELTPYEMLLDDIRSRRYKLNKVMVNGELPPRVKKDAFALILEFIRSRPPLVPVGQRRLKQLPPKEPPLHERLMDAIRQQHRLRHVTTRYSSILDYGWSFGSDTCGGLSLSSTATNDSEESSPSFQNKSSQNFSQRRLIHVDLMFSDDELEDSESNASSLTKHPSIEFLSSSSSSHSPQDVTPVIEHQSLPANLKRRASRLSWQKPTVAQRNDPSVAAAARTRKLWRRHSIDVCDAEHQEKLVRNDPFRRSIRVRQEVRIGDSSCANGSVDTKDSGASKIAIVNKQLECLSLTLEEVAHIRSVMTKAELETLLVTPQLYDDVAKSKVCFTCRKSRFNVLFSRPVKCHLCERSVCDKCSTKMHIPTHRFDRIPVYMLSPSTPTEEIAPEIPSRHEKSRTKKKDDIETAVQTFTSGSAPSSPNMNSRPNGSATVYREPAPHTAAAAATARSSDHRQQLEMTTMTGKDIVDDTESERKKKSWQESISKSLLKRPSILRVRAKLRCSPKAPSHDEAKSELCEKLKAPVLPVCRDCKYLVRSIILSNRNPIVKSHSDNSN